MNVIFLDMLFMNFAGYDAFVGLLQNEGFRP